LHSGGVLKGPSPSSADGAAARHLQTDMETVVCEENGRWQNLPWVYLTYAERNAWGELGWSEQWWDIAWEANAAVAVANGRCFGGRFLIGESGLDKCLVGELVRSYDDCRNASAEYQLAFPSDLFPLGAPVEDLQGTPGCNVQDRVGFQFNTAQITGSNQGYSPICMFDPNQFGGGCPSTTTTTAPPLPEGVSMENMVPEGVTTCYQDLTVDQQDAVRLLGYSVQAWHACMLPAWDPPTCPWPADIPMPDAPCLDHIDYLESKYKLSEPWSALTPRAQTAFEDLGWSADRWNNMDYPVSYSKPFSGQPPPTGLSKQEREAAEFLGYTADTWHKCEAKSECLARYARLEAKMATWSWRTTMPSGVRKQLEALGWTEDSWFEGEPPAVYQTAWDELRYPQRVAASLLGYTRDAWEGCVMSQCVVRYNYVLNKYKNVKWSEMKLAQRNAWMLLEHSQELWDQGGMMRTRLFSYRWDELTPAQQRQATFLGHDKGTWQGCNLEWGSDVNETSEAEVSGAADRTVRAVMKIERPFSEISGNIYGQQVSSMPTSFVAVFERSVARALFCGNPEFKNYTSGAVDAAGNPLCKTPEEFERQRRRIRVVSVLEGSILVDFIIVRNQTEGEATSLFLFNLLAKQLLNFATPISQDIEFSKFARVATLTEVPLSNWSPEQREQALVFERMRGMYSEFNACQLQADARSGAIRCPTAGAPPRSELPLRLCVAALAVLPFLRRDAAR